MENLNDNRKLFFLLNLHKSQTHIVNALNPIPAMNYYTVLLYRISDKQKNYMNSVQ